MSSFERKATTSTTKNEEMKKVRFNFKVVVAYLFFLILITVLFSQAGMLTGRFPTFNAGEWLPLTVGTLGPVLILILFNFLGQTFFKRSFFTEGDLRILFISLLAAMPFVKVTPFFLMVGMGARLLGQEDPIKYLDVVDRIPACVMPKSQEALMGFVIGGSSVPWGEWLFPIILWTLFYFIFYLVCLGIAALFRKQWTEHEHLTYPLMTPVTHITAEGEDGGISDIWKDGVMWAGLIVALLWVLLDFLHQKFPVVPFINRPWYFIGDFIRQTVSGHPVLSKAFSDPPAFNTGLIPHLVGIGFLVPLDISFNVWFFTAISSVVSIIFVQTGYWKPGGLTMYRLYGMSSLGGFMVLTIFYIWTARSILKKAFASAFGRGSAHEDDLKEGLSYKLSVWLIIFGTLYLIFFSTIFLKIDFIWSFCYFIIFMLLIVATTRLRVEAGNVYPQHVGLHLPVDVIRPIFGGRAVGVKNMIGFNFFFSNTLRGSIAGQASSVLESWKLGDESKMERRGITKVFMASSLFSIVSSIVICLIVAYKYGVSLSPRASYLRYDMASINQTFQGQPKPLLSALWFIIGGAAITGFFSYMRMRFIWWPFHPLGFVWGINYFFNWFVCGSFLVAWLAKLLILRYGGANSYKRTVPFFIGLVAGDLAGQLITLTLGIIIS